MCYLNLTLEGRSADPTVEAFYNNAIIYYFKGEKKKNLSENDAKEAINNGLLLVLPLLFFAGEDCAWNKEEDFPKIPPLLLDKSFQMVLPVLEGDARMVSWES